jgi:hypothetical protein
VMFTVGALVAAYVAASTAILVALVRWRDR